MRPGFDRERCQQAPRLLLAATFVSGVLVAGCGGGSTSTTTAGAGGAGGSASAAAAASGAEGSASTSAAGSTSTAGGGSGPLPFARCMRANGVPNFPDPKPGGGGQFAVPAGTNPAAPAFRAAQAKCQKLLGGGLLPG